MKKKHLQPLTPAVLYARVSSDRRDMDLSVAACPISASRQSWSRHNRGAS